MTEWMTKVKMQKSGDFAEFDCNRDGREVGCRDQPGANIERCHEQNQQTSGKKTRLRSPTRNERKFFRSLTERITRGNDNKKG